MQLRAGNTRGVCARIGLLALVGSLSVGLVACGESTSASTALHPTANATGKATTTTTGETSTTTSPLPASTFAAQDGTSDFCAAPTNVSAQPLSSLPQYPNAQLHVSQDTSGNYLFGYCSSDAVSAIASYYQQQLPTSGWSNVQSNQVSFLQQVTATQGSTHLTVSVEPSATLQNTTEVLVVVQG